MHVLLVVVDNKVDDIVFFHLHSGNETGRKFNCQIWTAVILIFPCGDVANNLLDAIVAKLVNDRLPPYASVTSFAP